MLCSVAQSYLTLCNPMYCSPPGFSVHGDSLGKNTGVGCHVLLQRIFSNPGIKPMSPHYMQILYHTSYQGSPRILEWIAYPFSRESSRPRNWTWSPALQADSLPSEPLGKPRKIFTYMVKYFSTSPKIINDERTVFLANGVKTGFPDPKEWSWTLSLYHIQN